MNLQLSGLLKTHFKIALIAFLCSFQVMVQPGFGQQPQAPHQRKSELTKEEIQRRIKEFKALPKDRKAELRKRWSRFENLPESHRRKLRRKFDSMCRKRKDFRRRSRRYQELSSHERGKLQRKYQKFQRLADRLVSRLPKSEQKELQSLPPQERSQRTQKLVRQYILTQRIDSLDLYDKKTRASIKSQVQSLEMKAQFDLVKQESVKHEQEFKKLYEKHFSRHHMKLAAMMQKLGAEESDSENATQKLANFASKLAPDAPAPLVKHFSRRFRYMHRHFNRRGRDRSKWRKFGPGGMRPGRRPGGSMRGGRREGRAERGPGQGNTEKTAPVNPRPGKKEGPRAEREPRSPKRTKNQRAGGRQRGRSLDTISASDIESNRAKSTGTNKSRLIPRSRRR